jgi:hypothetical protein
VKSNQHRPIRKNSFNSLIGGLVVFRCPSCGGKAKRSWVEAKHLGDAKCGNCDVRFEIETKIMPQGCQTLKDCYKCGAEGFDSAFIEGKLMLFKDGQLHRCKSKKRKK